MHVAVENPDLDPRPGAMSEPQRQILSLAALSEADALHGSCRNPTDLDRYRLDGSSSEDRDELGPRTRKGRPPCLDRVVIAMYDKARDARVRQAGQAVAKAQLCPKTALGPVIDVAGDYEKSHSPLETQLDERVESGERGLPKLSGDVWSCRTDALERRIKMQVCRVDETEVGSPGGIIHRSEATWGVYCRSVIPPTVSTRTGTR